MKSPDSGTALAVRMDVETIILYGCADSIIVFSDHCQRLSNEFQNAFQASEAQTNNNEIVKDTIGNDTTNGLISMGETDSKCWDEDDDLFISIKKETTEVAGFKHLFNPVEKSSLCDISVAKDAEIINKNWMDSVSKDMFSNNSVIDSIAV